MQWRCCQLVPFSAPGYGHISPTTTTGRAITIVYAIFGIPMFLILLADFGKLFTRGIKFLWAFVRRLYYTGSCRKVRRTVPVQVSALSCGAHRGRDSKRTPSEYESRVLPWSEDGRQLFWLSPAQSSRPHIFIDVRVEIFNLFPIINVKKG
jgi:hypothetical protein